MVSSDQDSNKIEISNKVYAVLSKQHVSNLSFKYDTVGEKICKITRDTGADAISVDHKLVKDCELTNKTKLDRVAVRLP